MRPGIAAHSAVWLKARLRPIPHFAQLERESVAFIHIPKNAGTSITKSLWGRNSPGHYKWWFYQYYFGAQRYREMFKFAFCRDPYSRLVSAYRYLARGGNTPSDAKFSKEHLAGCEDFSAFVQKLSHSSSVFNWVHFQPQYPFVFNERGHLMVDHLGRFEHFAEEIGHLGKILGREIPLTHEKNGGNTDLGAFYDSDRTREIVAALYARDFELLGYGTRL